MSARLASSLLSRTWRINFRRSQLHPHLAQPPRKRTMANAIPKAMKGVLIEKTGGVEVLEYKTDLPIPTPTDGQVLVKNEYIGINFIDTYYRSGLYPSPKPLVLGREGEGTVVATSGNTYDIRVGDRVAYSGGGGSGSYAEYTTTPASKAHVIPAGTAPGVGAAALLQGLTALTLIREAHPVQRGDWVLVHAAAGGVGLWLCQLLRVVGAHTIGTASTEEKMQLAKANGAEVVINYKEETDLVARVKEITGGEGVSVVFDSTGKDQFENDLEVVKRKGSVISYGNSSGPVPPLTIARLGDKNLKVMRPRLDAYIYTRAEFEHYTGELYDLILRENLNARIHEVYPLSEVARAHTDLESRKTTGKLLLKP